MKTLFLSLFLSVSLFAHCQTLDSTTIQIEVDSLIDLYFDLRDELKYDKSLSVIIQAEQKYRTAFGDESSFYAKITSLIGVTHYYKGDFSKGEPFWIKTKNIRKKTLGKDDPSYASSLNNLAVLYNKMGQFNKAETYFLKSKLLREKNLGKDHPDYSASLNGLGNLYLAMGEFKKAEPLYLESKEIKKRVLGEDHPDYATTLYNLGTLYLSINQFSKAEQCFLESKLIWQNVFGKGHPDYALSLSALANLYDEIGRYEQAEPLYLESLKINEKIIGNTHPNYVANLSNLAVLYNNMGLYEKAEPLYLETKVIMEKTLGKSHPDYAINLINLAGFYSGKGQYDKTEVLFLEAKKILDKEYGNTHPHYGLCLIGLADIYEDLGEYEKAESLYIESKEIYEKKYGKNNPNYATSLNNLAILYENTEQLERAEALYIESKDIYEKIYGKNHPNYANCLNNLAILYQELNQLEKVEALHLESKEICRQSLGENHPSYILSLNNLAGWYYDTGDYEKAKPFYLEANKKIKSHLIKSSQYLSERELSIYTNTYTQRHHILLNVSSNIDGLNGTLYDNILFYKGFLLKSAQEVSRLAMTDSTSLEMFNRLKGYHRLLSAEYSKPMTDRQGVMELEVNANTLEKELISTVASLGEAFKQVTWQDVQKQLKQNELAIEFVHYRNLVNKTDDDILYAALILKKEVKEPIFIPLFNEKSLDSLLILNQQRRSDYVNDLYSFEERGARLVEKSQKSLFELIWKPLESQLEDVKTIYYSPSGFLHRLNLGAISIDEDENFIDKFKLVQVNSTRQLEIPQKLTNPGATATLFGGIRYDMDSVVFTQANEEFLIDNAIASRGESNSNLKNSALRGGSWNNLKWTEKEINFIDKILVSSQIESSIRSGFTATEESFRLIGEVKNSPRILHLATHGFFFPDPKDKPQYNYLDRQEPVFKISDNPMIRSGIILAGGNYAWQTGNPIRSDIEDGILTAYEISQMNLSNTELVVLSACETGLGDIKGNEGVYGLQRAFKIAGAKYLIMSLWQVPDRQTMEFMKAFYQNWLQEQMTIPDAFRNTQKQMRDRFIDPYAWAGFVLVE